MKGVYNGWAVDAVRRQIEQLGRSADICARDHAPCQCHRIYRSLVVEGEQYLASVSA